MTTEELVCVIAVPLAFIGYYCLLLIIDFATGHRSPSKKKSTPAA